MELRQLRYFVAVADELHLGRAAERLGIAQPSLSQQLQTLEGQLGVQLLERSNQAVTLTAAGKALLYDAEDLLDRADLLRRSMQRFRPLQQSALTVSSFVWLSPGLLARVVADLRAAIPDVEITVRDLTTPETIAALRAGRVDVGFALGPLRPDEAAGLELVTVERPAAGVVLARAHRLAERPALALADLAGEPLVLFPRDFAPGLHDATVTACRQAGFEPDLVGETGDPADRYAGVADGEAVAVGSADYGAQLRLPGTLWRPLHRDPVGATVVAVWRASPVGPLQESLRRIVRAVALD